MNSPSPFPRMLSLEQTYPPSPKLDFLALLEQQFSDTGLRSQIRPGMRIALGVGSRGITNLKEIAGAAVDVLLHAGARPFIVPAMGSHGGATAEGQIAMLAQYGVTAESMGVPIEAGMEVRKIGTALDGLDVVFSAPALAADGVVVLNRVKPHTDFRGTMGSGLQKMLVIGFGKQVGAGIAHRAAAHLGHEAVLRGFAQTILEKVPIFCGIGLVEDQHHQTAQVQVIRPEHLVAEEDKLFRRAEALLARLPLEDIDLLIIDRMGKDISGSGMDTNVIGRDIHGYLSSLHPNGAVTPRVARIFVRELTPASSGNGIGIGLADFTTARLVKSLNLQFTYMNALTSLGLLPAKVPIHFESDREAIQAALSSLASSREEDLRVVRIADTLNLERFQASESCTAALDGRGGVKAMTPPREMEFDSSGNLLPLDTRVG